MVPGASPGSGWVPRWRRRWCRPAASRSGWRPRCWYGPPGSPEETPLVLAVAGALRGEVYAAAYRFLPDRIHTELAPSVRHPDELMTGSRPSRRSWSGKRRPTSSRHWRRGPAGRSSALRMARPTPAGYSSWSGALAALAGWKRQRDGSRCTAGRRKHRLVGRWPMDAPYRIRSAVPADAAPLVAIERRCFSDPWSETSFREALDSPWSFGLVAHNGQGIAGYLIAREVAGTGEVLNLAVSPDFRRRGVARALLRCRARLSSEATGRGGVSGGERIEPLCPGALFELRVQSRSGSGPRTTAIPRRMPWCSGWRWSSARRLGQIA